MARRTQYAIAARDGARFGGTGTSQPLTPGRPRRLAPQAHIGQAAGSGHFVQLEVPAQVNAMIDRHLELTD
ncbi:hypothetical protein [Micromonospora sp. ATCC 39149]|uniref:hypothetical protein n=1 Tax=Micromonospora sp. (strain ATCC 39149 / NRRL 15099 / SCC 1413) TaxID=219305 RepID=UPI0005680573|nr:hypothetical protein [Micromonospora sp. ATCC 39149]